MEKIKSNEQLDELRKQVIPPGHASATSIYVESAKGATIRDVSGKEYIDFAGGIGVMNVGHSNPKVIAAIKDQAEKFTHSCFMVSPYESAVMLAQKLCQITPGNFPKKAILANCGAEAVENAVKIARCYTKKTGIIVFENAFHGRTLLTMTMSCKINPYKLGFGPFAPEIYRMPFGDVAGPEKLKDFFLKYINPESVAAVVAEPVQGEGVIAAPPGYFQELVKICHDNGILFISEEVQSGMGRTGKMFAIEHWGVEPDLITIAKSIAAGMPLSAVVGRQEIMDSVHVGGLGGTYCANPLACRAALAVLEVYEEEKLLEKAELLGKKLKTQFGKWQNQFSILGEIRGLGAMLGLELVIGPKGEPASNEAKRLAKYCHEKGLIIITCGINNNIIKIVPPLVITDSELEKALSILEDGLSYISA